MVKTAFGLAAFIVLAALTGCSSGSTINLDSTNINFNLAPQEAILPGHPQDIKKSKGEAEVLFAPKKVYEIAGLLHSSDEVVETKFDVFASAVTIIWSRPAIELTLLADELLDETELSSETKAVRQKLESEPFYIKEHTIPLFTIGATPEIDDALRNAGTGCGVYMKGIVLEVKSAKYKGSEIHFSVSAQTLYVTHLRLDDKTFTTP
jgi:hypothetical protein